MDVSDAQLCQFVAEGLSQREIARRTGLSRATLYRRFQRLGLTPGQAPASPAPPALQVPAPPAPPAPQVLPAPPAPERKDIQQWTVRLSKSLIEHIKTVAYERRMNPSEVVEAYLWKALGDDRSSPP